MTKVIAVTNQKGGVGKTTTATALATGLTREGYKTLLGDMDPQCNSTDTYRAIVHDQATLFDVLVKGEPILEAIQHTEIGDILAGDPLLNDAEKMLSEQGREYRLKEAMEALNQMEDPYDFVILDTPPDLGILLTNALTAAHSCIIPITPDRYALQGLSQLDESIARVRKYSNPDLEIDGLLIVMNEARTKLAREVQEMLPEVCEQLGTDYFKTAIRKTTSVKEAQKRRVSLFTWAPDCTAAQDYEAFIDEYMRKESMKEEAQQHG